MPHRLTVCVILAFAAAAVAAPIDRRTQVLEDRQNVSKDPLWVYNDLEKGKAQAKESGKPMLIVFRCIPCHACSGFDAQVLQRAEARMEELMKKFVCVRIVYANGMDLQQFQFDYDLSFAAFFMNSDGTIYGRYGTRSDVKETERDLSMDSFSKAMEGALEVHKDYPANKASLTAKRGPVVTVAKPELYPKLTKYTQAPDYNGQVLQSCIHCHMIGDAQRAILRQDKKPLTDEVVFPWPMPDVVGLSLDPKERAKVTEVASNSAAAKAGVKVGDEIIKLDGQPILSIADVQYVLHHTPATGGSVKASLKRGSETREVSLKLDNGWRRISDITWRASAWEYRRMGLGGMKPDDMSDADRKAANLTATQMAFKLAHVGQYGDHAVAKRAGFEKGDIIIMWDGLTNRMTESALLAYGVQKKQPGDTIKATILRGGKKMDLKVTLP
ncbi:MAG: Trx7/PDZ domain-containing (seleno)protein [Phycisphaeraceae bacterium]